jgi:hypothetical protein
MRDKEEVIKLMASLGLKNCRSRTLGSGVLGKSKKKKKRRHTVYSLTCKELEIFTYQIISEKLNKWKN